MIPGGAQMLAECASGSIEIRKNETAMNFYLSCSVQPELLLWLGVAVRKRDSSKRTIKAETPIVIRALKERTVPTMFPTQSSTAMGAPVSQHIHRIVVFANHDHRFVSEVARDPIPLALYFRLVAHKSPPSEKDFFHFFCKGFRVV